MNLSDIVPIGQLGRLHGVKGEINAFCTVDRDYLFRLAESKAPLFLFVTLEGLPVPFRIEYLRNKDKEAFLIKFTRVNDKEAANALTNATFGIEERFLSDEASFSAQFFIGFSVLNEHDIPLGIVADVDDSTANMLFTICDPDGREWLIPVADELITFVDAPGRRIGIKVPEGLTEL